MVFFYDKKPHGIVADLDCGLGYQPDFSLRKQIKPVMDYLEAEIAGMVNSSVVCVEPLDKLLMPSRAVGIAAAIETYPVYEHKISCSVVPNQIYYITQKNNRHYDYCKAIAHSLTSRYFTSGQ